MAKVNPKKTALDNFNDKYAPVYGFESFVAEHPNGKGDLGDLVEFWQFSSKRLGIEDDDIECSQDKLVNKYINGDRKVFFKPGKVMYEKDQAAIVDYTGEHTSAIINATDNKTLREIVLPYTIKKNYKTDDDKYKPLEKLVGEEAKLKTKIARIQDKDTREEAVQGLVDAREAHYDKRYANNDDAREILKELISESSEVNTVKSNYAAKRKELDDSLGKNLKGFVKSLGWEAKDIVELYGGIFAAKVEEANKS
jgi:hypothetical protein